MKIAQVGPLIESVPPKFYGGTERVVSYLTEELVAQGHDVTLFASGDSITSARLVPCCKEALRLNPAVRDPIPYYMMMLDRVRRMAPKFDVLHFHIDQFHFPIFHAVARKTLTTLHGRQDLPDLQQLYHAFPEMGVVSISNAQRNPIPSANFAGTVYHGIPQHLHKPTFTPRGGYLAFLGRISPEKRLDRAIEIARAAGFPLCRRSDRRRSWPIVPAFPLASMRLTDGRGPASSRCSAVIFARLPSCLWAPRQR